MNTHIKIEIDLEHKDLLKNIRDTYLKDTTLPIEERVKLLRACETIEECEKLIVDILTTYQEYHDLSEFVKQLM